MNRDNVTSIPLDGNAFGRWLSRASVYTPQSPKTPLPPFSDGRHAAAALKWGATALLAGIALCGLAYAAHAAIH